MIVLIFIALGLLALFLLSLKGLIYNCAPNEVLIFSGKRRRVGDRVYGYRLIKGGSKPGIFFKLDYLEGNRRVVIFYILDCSFNGIGHFSVKDYYHFNIRIVLFYT